MSRKQDNTLNEGPLDFLRGAGAEVGRKVANSAPVRAANDVYQAGKVASAQGDQRTALVKAVAQLANLLAYIDKYAPEVAKAGAQEEPQQQPQQQQQTQANPRWRGMQQVQPGAQQAGADQSSMTTDKNGYQAWQFNSFMQAIHGEQLDEGVWDFVKGAGGAVADKVYSKIADYANKPSVFKDIYQAGKKTSDEANVKRAMQAKQQASKVLQDIFKIAQQFGDQAPTELMNAVRKAGGNQTNRIVNVIRKNASKFGLAL